MKDSDITITIRANATQLAAAIKGAVGNVKDLSKTVVNESTKAAEATERLTDRFDGLREKAAMAMQVVGIATVAGLGFAVTAAGDFQSSLSQLQQASGATSEQMQQLQGRARELGKDTDLAGVTASKAAATMVELSKAGLSVKDTLDASKGVMSLAKAGNIDFAEAAVIAASALNAFSMKGSDAVKVADALAAGANASQANLGDLAFGMQQSATVAKQFGLSLNENITALALFANNGIKGSDAGTSLKTMLIALANPSKAASNLMKDIGFNAYDAQGNFVGLREMSLRLSKSMEGLSDKQKQSALATIFGSDAFRAAAVLADNAGKSYDGMSKSVGEAGAASEAAAAQQGAFEKSLENFKNAAADIGLVVGEKLLPPLTELIKLATENLEPTFNFLANNGPTIAAGVIAIGAAFATVRVAGLVSDLKSAESALDVFIGEKNANGVHAIGGAFSSIKNGVITASTSFAGFVKGAALGTAQIIKSAALSAGAWLRTAALWVASGARAVAMWVAQTTAMAARSFWFALAQKSPATAAALTWVASAVKMSTAWAINAARASATSSVVALKMAGHATVAGAKWIAQPAVIAARWIAQFARMLAFVATAAARMAAQALSLGVAWVRQSIAASSAWMLNFAKMIPMMLGAAVGMAANALIASGAWIAGAVATAAAWVIANAAILGLWGLIIAAVVGAVALIVANWSSISTFFEGVFDAIVGAVSTAINWVKNNWPLLLAILTGPVGIATLLIIQNWDKIKAAFAAAWQWIKGVWNGVVGFFRGVWNGIVNTFKAVGNWFGNIFRGAWNGIKSVFAGVGGFFRGVWNTIVGIFGRVGSSIGNAIGGAVKGVVNSILGFAENTINGFIRAINTAIETINNIPGVNIGTLGYLNIPRLATGGIVPATPGGRQVLVAEGGQNEWVIPESKMASVVRQLAGMAHGNGQGTTVGSSGSSVVIQSGASLFTIVVQNTGDKEFTDSDAVSMAKKIMRALRSQGLKVDEMEALR